MRKRFDQQLEELNVELIKMGSLCERAIRRAVELLQNPEDTRVSDVDRIEEEVNHKEREIETLCMKLLLQQQPVAKDLREISSALKMISDLERIGDQASDIAEIAGFIEGDHTKDHTHISAMGQAASAMVTDAVKSFVNRDLSLAHSVMKDDDIVDNHFEEVKKEIVNLIRKEEAGAELSLDLLMIAKYLERIGDHAVNVAEWVEFSITGEHLSDELRKVK